MLKTCSVLFYILARETYQYKPSHLMHTVCLCLLAWINDRSGKLVVKRKGCLMMMQFDTLIKL